MERLQHTYFSNQGNPGLQIVALVVGKMLQKWQRSLQIKIPRSVGKRGVNNTIDVKLVQTLLRKIARFLHSDQPVRFGYRRCFGYGNGIRFTPGWESTPDPQVEVTGKIDDIPVQTIIRFQKDVLGTTTPDGRVDPGGTTFGKLVNQGVGPFFPFAAVPEETWSDAPRCIGARRSSGKRAHAGSDLYFPASPDQVCQAPPGNQSTLNVNSGPGSHAGSGSGCSPRAPEPAQTEDTPRKETPQKSTG